MSNCKVSIIIPVYNTEKYLRKCIESIVSQTYTNWELILVNDGSTDSSCMICEEYAEKDKRVRVYNKSNTGVSDSRNLGIKESSGKYLVFVDADDYWLSVNDLATLVSISEENQIDVLRGEYMAVDEDGQYMFDSRSLKLREKVADRLLSSSEFLNKVLCGESFIFLSLFRKEVLDNNIFSKDRIFLEDLEFYSRLMLQHLKCMYVQYPFYAYRKHADSVSAKVNIKKIRDSFSMCYVFHDLMRETNIHSKKRFYKYNSIMMYYWTLDTLSMDPYYNENKRIIDQLSLMELWKDVRVWSKNTKFSYPIVIYLSPLIGVKLLRYRHRMGNMLRNLIR